MKMTNIFRLMILFIILFVSSDRVLNGQPSAPPGGHGLNGNQGPGGAAPVDGGSLILLMSGLSYGAIKVIRAYKEKKDVL